MEKIRTDTLTGNCMLIELYTYLCDSCLVTLVSVSTFLIKFGYKKKKKFHRRSIENVHILVMYLMLQAGFTKTQCSKALI